MPDPSTDKWLAKAATQTTAQIRGSACTIQIVPGADPDAKVALELGLTLLLDKPLILVVPAGRAVPEHLANAADEVIWWHDDADMHRRVTAALRGLGLRDDEDGEQ